MEGSQHHRGRARLAEIQARARLARQLAGTADRARCQAAAQRWRAGVIGQLQGIHGPAGTRKSLPGRARQALCAIPGMESPQQELTGRVYLSRAISNWTSSGLVNDN